MKTRTEYTRQLDDLSEQVARLGVLVVADVRASALAADGDEGAGEGLAASRKDMGRLREAIESTCMSAMLLQQPVAGDLRLVTGSFRLVSDLVRIDEMSRDIAVVAAEMPHKAMRSLGGVIPQMADEVATMVEKATNAFLSSDTDEAASVFSADDAVDDLYDEAESTVVRLIKSGDVKARACPELLMVAKYYERMGDHAQRIADWAVFRDTGEHGGAGID
ncbi:MAG: phosphate signaling complex protein PhoU [Atopobiaceae bacterium]|jgi:phosphate transport system protein|nr:phosphate signaling complex protein PhoU [Atopobiaceae bacterium]MCI2172794.1 phosphate signaling complex protein PhoU [Atopobiaceae bacterium]MCI2207101.1 phosphate signaling complex protein PhoU [Atopobiaceae bacterium]